MWRPAIAAERPSSFKVLREALRAALVVLPMTVAAAFPAAADEDGQHLSLRYSGSFALLRVARAQIEADVSPDRYEGALTFRSAGLAGFFKTARIDAQGQGARDAAGFAPETYAHVEANGRKRREVTLDWEPTDVIVAASPPFGSLGDPAPTPEQKREALDPLAMVLQIAMAGGEEPCSRIVPVFDSKLRYDLAFEPDGVEDDLRTDGYRGPAHRCRAYYRPIAGYDPEDLAEPEVYATPIRLWLAEVAPGVLVPALIYVRFDALILPFSVKLELQEATITSAG
jgi:hypothetical protein